MIKNDNFTFFLPEDLRKLELALRGYRLKELNGTKLFGALHSFGIDLGDEDNPGSYVYLLDTKGRKAGFDEHIGELVDLLECPFCSRKCTYPELEAHPTPCCYKLFVLKLPKGKCV